MSHVPPPEGAGPGRWQWAAYPGQAPQWFWFPDPPPAPPPPAPAPPPPSLWDDFRLRARRMGVVLMVVGVACAGVLVYDSVASRDVADQIALDIEREDPVADGAAAGDPVAGGVEAAPTTGDVVLDELADILHDRAQAATDAVRDGQVDLALEYYDPTCREQARAGVQAAVDQVPGLGDARLAVAAVQVTLTDGKVDYRVVGTPSDAFDPAVVPTREAPEFWVHRDGHWYRDVVGCQGGVAG